MSAPLEPTSVVQVSQRPRRSINASMVIAAVGVLLVVASFRAHEASFFLRLPSFVGGALLAVVGVQSQRRAKPDQLGTVFAVLDSVPTGPGAKANLLFIGAGAFLAALFLALSAPAYLTLLGMIAAVLLIGMGWGSLPRG